MGHNAGVKAVKAPVIPATGLLSQLCVCGAVGDVLGSFMVLAQGQQVAGEPASTPVRTGFDGMFWIALAAFVVFGAGTIWAFRALAATRRPSSESALT